jgi:hypothetical protein
MFEGILAVALLTPVAVAASSHGSHSYHSHSSSHSYHSHSYSHGSEHVGSYRRRNETAVHSYTRHSVGTAPAKSHSYHSYSTHTYHPRSTTTHAIGARDKHGHLKRSEEAKDSFKHQHPCPSTGRSSGSCPGYVIDHVRPLECGGADASSNMQWQTIAAGKAKDKTERSCR